MVQFPKFFRSIFSKDDPEDDRSEIAEEVWEERQKVFRNSQKSASAKKIIPKEKEGEVKESL